MPEEHYPPDPKGEAGSRAYQDEAAAVLYKDAGGEKLVGALQKKLISRF